MRLIKTITVLAGIVLLLAVSTSVGVQWAQQMSLARQYEKQGRLEDALKIYIELRAERPEDVELMARIQGVYKELKRYPQLIEFLNHRLDKSPGNLDLHMALGEVFFLSGQVQQARETWLEAIRLSPGKEINYLRVGRAFWERGMLAEAEEVFLRGRKVLSDKTLFAEPLARIYELGAKYRAATGEYLTWLTLDVRRMSYVNARLAQFHEDPQVGAMVQEALSSAVGKDPQLLEFRHLFGHHLIRMGKPDLAYEQFLILNDREKGSSGKVLMGFAKRCAELGYHAAAIKACQEVVVRYPDEPTAGQAQLAVGDNLAAMQRYQDALAAYEELILRHPKSSAAAEALYASGEIHFLHLNDTESALTAYRVLAAQAGGLVRSPDAAFRIGDCLEVKGDLQGAREQYQLLARVRGPEEVQEKAAYKLAELSFLEGKFEQAKEGFDKLVSDFPQGFYVNDALVYSLFLEDGLSQGEEALKAYAQAMSLGLQRNYRMALSAYQQVMDQFPSTNLGDYILMETAQLREKSGQHQEALADLNKLIADYPQSRLCPEAQRRIGEIYELRLKDLTMAIQAYEQVLSDYPRYLFYDDVRKKVRRLKGEKAS